MTAERGLVDVRVVEVLGWIRGHADPPHQRLRATVQCHGDSDDLRQTQDVEAVLERCQRRLGGVAMAPRRSRQPPGDLDTGERHLLFHSAQPGEADELAGSADLDRPEAKAVAVQVVLEGENPRRGLLEGQRWPEVLPDLRIGVHRRPRCEIGLPPAAHDQSFSVDFRHPASVFGRRSSRRGRPVLRYLTPPQPYDLLATISTRFPSGSRRRAFRLLLPVSCGGWTVGTPAAASSPYALSTSSVQTARTMAGLPGVASTPCTRLAASTVPRP